MKYVGKDGKVRTLIVERHSFRGVENYFTNFLLYQDSLETDENPHSEEPDTGNETDTEPEEDECLWKINPLVISIDKLNFNTTANVESEWFINEDLDLAYLSTFASDSVLSDTNTNMDSDPWSAMNALTSLRAPIKSSLLVHKKIRGAHNALFKLSAKRKGQKPILFGQVETEPVACESSRGNSKSP